MSLIVNGIEIPNTGDIVYSVVHLEKIICDGVTVWEKQKDITLTPGDCGGLTVTGDSWANSIQSFDRKDADKDPCQGEKDGVTYTLVVKDVNTTSYSKIILYGIVEDIGVTTSNAAGWIFSILVGELKSQTQISHYHPYVDGYDPYQSKQNTSFQLSLDISSLSGALDVTIAAQFFHVTDRNYGGNANASYTLQKLELVQ